MLCEKREDNVKEKKTFQYFQTNINIKIIENINSNGKVLCEEKFNEKRCIRVKHNQNKTKKIMI